MPQPILGVASGLTIMKFGNAPLPNGQGVLANINLNDGVNTFLQNFGTDETNRQIGLAQLLYRARGAYTSDDWQERVISLPLRYREDGAHFLGQFIAQLTQADEQQFTTDNLTYLIAKFQRASGRVLLTRTVPYTWGFNLELVGKSPWFQDASSTTMGAVTLTVDSGQSFNITYAGSVWCEPVWTYHVPSSNGVAINTIQIKNTMTGQALVVNFLSVAALSASVDHVITIDCAASTVTDNLGISYDYSGTFPVLVPPAGTVNPFTITAIPASGATSGCTIACTHFPRWQI